MTDDNSEEPRQVCQSQDYRVTKRAESRNYPFTLKWLSFAKSYIEGGIEVVLRYHKLIGGECAHVVVRSAQSADNSHKHASLWIADFNFLTEQLSRRWKDAMMLVSDVQLMEIEQSVLTSWVGLHLKANVLENKDGGAIPCFYMSIDGTLHRGPVNSIFAERELTMLGGLMPVGFDQDTVCVIKGSPEIVDGITQRSGEMFRGVNCSDHATSFQRALLIFGAESVFVVRDKAPEKSFHLSDVLIRPFYFEERAGKIELTTHLSAT